MPPPTDVPVSVIRTNYYLGIRQTLLEHVRDREITGVGELLTPDHPGDPTGPHDQRQVTLHIHDADDLDEAIRSGVIGFLTPGLTGAAAMSVRITCGEGAGIDTVAMTALNLIESIEPDGLVTTAMTDGTGGLFLFAGEVNTPSRNRDPAAVWSGAESAASGHAASVRASTGHASGLVSARYAHEVASRAPEIATTNPADASGRALVQALEPGSVTPVPYSLVSGNATGVVVPLTLDEVAAASAGMPLDIEFTDVLDRIAGYGDLARALGGATAPPA